MGSIFEISKRIGAIFVILVLILMMGLIFSSQPLDEIMQVFVNETSIGQFDGEDIPIRYYALFENGCRTWIEEQKLGQADFFLQQCLNTRIRQTYVLAKIGARMAFHPSVSLVKRDVLEQSREEYQQQADIDPEDRLSLNEIYRYNLSGLPIDLRVRQRAVQDSYNVLRHPFPTLNSKKEWERAIAQTTLQLRVVYYKENELLEEFKKKITPDAAEVEKRFTNEQAAEKKARARTGKAKNNTQRQ